MSVTWYWRAAVGASGVQELDRVGPAQDSVRADVERRSTPWLRQRSPSLALFRIGSTTAVVCDALATETTDEHNRPMRARFTLIAADREAMGALRLALAYFAAGTAPDFSVVGGRVELPDGWDRPRRLPRVAGDPPVGPVPPGGRVQVAGRDDFARRVLALYGDDAASAEAAATGATEAATGTTAAATNTAGASAATGRTGATPAVANRRAGTALLCLYSDWLTSDQLHRLKGAVIVGGERLRPATVPKADGSLAEGPAPSPGGGSLPAVRRAGRLPAVRRAVWLPAVLAALAVACLALVVLVLL